MRKKIEHITLIECLLHGMERHNYHVHYEDGSKKVVNENGITKRMIDFMGGLDTKVTVTETGTGAITTFKKEK